MKPPVCEGSHHLPDGEAAQLPGRVNPRGICPSCGGVYAIRLDGRILMHQPSDTTTTRNTA